MNASVAGPCHPARRFLIRLRLTFAAALVAVLIVPTARSGTSALLHKREHRQVVVLHRHVGTVRFFDHHRWLLHGRTRSIALKALHVAHVWIPILRRELRKTRAALHPSPRSLVDSCLSELIQRESGWDHTATNRTTGAYGLPQALPGSKMASAGSDWATNPVTQIRWMRGYVGKYGGSCSALAFQKRNGWY